MPNESPENDQRLADDPPDAHAFLTALRRMIEGSERWHTASSRTGNTVTFIVSCHMPGPEPDVITMP